MGTTRPRQRAHLHGECALVCRGTILNPCGAELHCRFIAYRSFWLSRSWHTVTHPRRIACANCKMPVIAQVLHIAPIMQRWVLALCDLQDVADATRKSDRDRFEAPRSARIPVQLCQLKDVRRGFAQ